MDVDDVDKFGSVAWDTQPGAGTTTTSPTPGSSSAFMTSPVEPLAPTQATQGGQTAWIPRIHAVQVKEAVKELEGTKDMFVSYLVTARVRCPF